MQDNQRNQDSINADIEAFTKFGVAAPSAEKSKDKGEPSGVGDTLGAFFTQTTVIRVTTILLIAFLVQILVTLYRYNTRLPAITTPAPTRC